MSLLPFKPSLDNYLGNDWLTFDPFRESFYGGMKSPTGFDLSKPFSPLLTADLIEVGDEFKVIADLPGVDPANLEVTVPDSHSLLIKAERENIHDTTNDKVHSLERSYGKVQRKIRLPKSADLDRTSISFKNGVLCICIPKSPEQAPKKLNIET